MEETLQDTLKAQNSLLPRKNAEQLRIMSCKWQCMWSCPNHPLSPSPSCWPCSESLFGYLWPWTLQLHCSVETICVRRGKICHSSPFQGLGLGSNSLNRKEGYCIYSPYYIVTCW